MASIAVREAPNPGEPASVTWRLTNPLESK
jgi:hypothetical protein